MQITVTIKPNSKHREEVVAVGDDSLTVYTKEPALEGRANEAVVRLLAKYYGVPKSQVRIVRGATARVKKVEVRY